MHRIRNHASREKDQLRTQALLVLYIGWSVEVSPSPKSAHDVARDGLAMACRITLFFRRHALRRCHKRERRTGETLNITIVFLSDIVLSGEMNQIGRAPAGKNCLRNHGSV